MDTLTKIQDKIVSERMDVSLIDKDLAMSDTRVLDLVREACLIESFFGVYIGRMLDLFWDEIDASAMFSYEAYEAFTHYLLLRRYLDVVGYQPITDEELITLREKDRDLQYTDKAKELVNFMATEHFAAHYFSDLAETTKEPVLKNLLIRFSAEEVVHSQLAEDVLSAHLQKDPTLKRAILDHAQHFQHIGAYALPTVSNVKQDNLKAIQRFNNKIRRLAGESLSEDRVSE